VSVQQAIAGRVRHVITAGGVYLAALFLGEGYATALQRFVVAPNEQTKETPFIVHNIAATRAAYAIQDVAEREMSGDAVLTDPGEGEWGYRTSGDGAGERVPRLAAAELVEQKRREGFRPFIAKIDIEGAEEELFSADTGWVDEFPLLIVELHDWLLPKSASSRNFLRCMAERDRDFVYLGENVFSIANS